MFLFLPHCALYIFTTEKRVNNEGEYVQEIPVNFYFYGTEKAIKLAKQKNGKDQRKLKRNCKKLSKEKLVEMFYMTCY